MKVDDSIGAIARAVLYEGYVLYPYRTSSLKNSRPSMMGTLYPAGLDVVRDGRERAYLRMQCLLLAEEDARVSMCLRFLQLTSTEIYECVEREVFVEATVRELSNDGIRQRFVVGEDVRLSGEFTIQAKRLDSGVVKLTIGVRNITEAPEATSDQAALYALHSAHIAISVERGRFISLTDPSADWAEDAASCENAGVWPVLVGNPEAATTILASPIVLPDYPAIAPESPGDLHDSSEIDEILTLRIITMTEEEKASARASGERTRNIIDRAEALTRENLAQLHGAFRAPADSISWSSWDTQSRSPIDVVRVEGVDLTIGDRVMLRPKNRADILDSVLEGRIATIAAIEQDLEDRLHVAVVVDDDPGRDLGELRKPGHRFFFSPIEIEPLPRAATEANA